MTFNPSAGTFTATSDYSYMDVRYNEQGLPYGVTIRRPFTVKGMTIRERQNLASYSIGYLLISESVQVSYDPDRFANTMISHPASVYVTY